MSTLHRRFPSMLAHALAVMTMLATLPAMADLLPPAARDAAERLLKNKNAFDNVDSFCAGKKPGAACTMPGNPFGGGGDGICKNELNRSSNLIDLTCQHKELVFVFDPQLPEGGFVLEPMLCGNGLDLGSQFTCKPTLPPPPDRFCKEKKVGDACQAEVSVDGKRQFYPGICQKVSEKAGYYFQGRRTASREVIRCEPPEKVEHPVQRVNPLKKLLQ